MRIRKLIVPALVLVVAPQCIRSSGASIGTVPCPRVEESEIKADWDPSTLAGEYRVEWISDTGATHRTERFRLFLWRTSMRDSSARRHKVPTPGDTAIHPLFGVLVRDSGTFSTRRIEQLRSAIDPIYPPALLYARVSTNPQMPVREWTVLLLHTVGNRRDGVMVLDGSGIGMWVRQADADGFSGEFVPWGIVVEDEGHYCARRVSS
jgi:hypothetical protein